MADARVLGVWPWRSIAVRGHMIVDGGASEVDDGDKERRIRGMERGEASAPK